MIKYVKYGLHDYLIVCISKINMVVCMLQWLVNGWIINVKILILRIKCYVKIYQNPIIKRVVNCKVLMIVNIMIFYINVHKR